MTEEVTLTAAQRRVFGVLMEKSLTTPGSYPLTLNALMVGCNQLSCREPVMQMTESDVSEAIRELKRRQIVREPEYERNSRVDRFRHAARERFGWDERQQAVLAELLLRGPQTLGELKTNASRMTPLPELQTVSGILSAFASQNPPLAQELPRQPGKSVPRYDHLLYPENEQPPAPAVIIPIPASAPPDASPLESRVAALEREVAGLRQTIQELRADRMLQ